MIVLEIGGYYRNKTADNGFELDVEKVREKEMKLKNKTKQKKIKEQKNNTKQTKKKKTTTSSKQHGFSCGGSSYFGWWVSLTHPQFKWGNCYKMQRKGGCSMPEQK